MNYTIMDGTQCLKTYKSHFEASATAEWLKEHNGQHYDVVTTDADGYELERETWS